MEVDDIISYHDVVTQEKIALQKRMNYGVGKNYSVFLMSLREGAPYADAIDAFRAAVDEEPYSVTATYNLGLALSRAGRREEGQQAMERSQALRAGGYGTVFSNNYLEQGRYGEAIASTGAEPELVDRSIPEVVCAVGVLAPLQVGRRLRLGTDRGS